MSSDEFRVRGDINLTACIVELARDNNQLALKLQAAENNVENLKLENELLGDRRNELAVQLQEFKDEISRLWRL